MSKKLGGPREHKEKKRSQYQVNGRYEHKKTKNGKPTKKKHTKEGGVATGEKKKKVNWD